MSPDFFMPTYDYICLSHGNFEQSTPVAYRDAVSCPKCNKLAKRVFNVIPVHYAGTGWASIDGGKRFESQLSKDGLENYRRKKVEGKIK